jgi:NTE family protein
MHAAFEVGVLTAVLERMEAKTEPQFELMGLSGTSAGALCALMVWYGLESPGGSPRKAIDQLEGFWNDFIAQPGPETALNWLTYGTLMMEESEVPWLGLYAPIFGLNPRGEIYKQFAHWLPRLRVRQNYFDLDKLLEDHCPHLEDIKQAKTRLLIGATEVVNGYETVFDSDTTTQAIESWHQRLPLTLSGVAASGTLPAFREAEQIEKCYYWDGLYSQNPPIRDFVSDYRKAPEEIWILRINPQKWPHLPRTNAEIQDRQNELMGNLSLHKDLDFILKVNTWRGLFAKENKDLVFEIFGQKDLIVRTIKISEPLVNELSFASKFDRSPACMRKLRNDGYAVAKDFLAKWPNVPWYPDDAGYPRPADAR